MSEPAPDLSPLSDIDAVLSSEAVRTRRSRRLWAVLGGVALAALGGFLAMRSGGDVAAYETGSVAAQDLEVTVTAVGRIEPLDEVDVGSELSGILREVAVDAGASVAAGEVLAKLDPAVLEAQLDSARAQVQAAQASLTQTRAAEKLALRDRDTAAGLAAEGAQTKEVAGRAASVYAQAVAARNAARAQVKAAKAALRLSTVNLEKSTIKAPIAGVVLTRNAEVGQSVVSSLQAQTLFVIAQDLGNMQVVLEIDEADIARVRPGQDVRFTVAAFPHRTFEGSVLSVGLAPKPSMTVVTYEALVGVDNADKALVPGMTASATIVSATHPGALVVPNAALRFQPADTTPEALPDGQGRLWVEGDDGPRALVVDVGATNGRVTAVTGEGVKDDLPVLLGVTTP